MQIISLEDFSEAMLEFVKSSEKIVLDPDAPCSRLPFENLCVSLGIARLEIVHTIPDRANKLFLSDRSLALFSLDSYDESRAHTITKYHEDGCVSNYIREALKRTPAVKSGNQPYSMNKNNR